MDAPDHSNVWQPFHHHLADYHPGVDRLYFSQTPANQCNWVHNAGHTGTSSLQAITRKKGVAGWQTPLFNRPKVKPGHWYRMAVYIRTEALKGRGATLGYLTSEDPRMGRLYPETPQARKVRPMFAGRRVRGNTDWTRVEILIPPLKKRFWKPRVLEYRLMGCYIQPVLWHEGTGTSWFDDFTLEPVTGGHTVSRIC